MFKRIGARVTIDEVKKLGRGERLIETVWVRLESEEQKKEVMGKSRLKRRKEKIMENWTLKERRMMWKMEKIARKEMAKRRKV